MGIKRHKRGRRLTQVVVHGDTVYVAGQVADDTSVGVRRQTQQILKKIETLLTEVGSHKSNLLSANVWLADIRTFDEMNAAWDAWVDPKNTPARATVEARMAAPEYLVEIMVLAAMAPASARR